MVIFFVIITTTLKTYGYYMLDSNMQSFLDSNPLIVFTFTMRTLHYFMHVKSTKPVQVYRRKKM